MGIKPLVDLLKLADAKTIGVALEALDNILKLGATKQAELGAPENLCATLVEQAEGLQALEALQEDPNEEVYQKAMKMLESYFPLDDDAETWTGQGASQLQFGAEIPQGGFNFS